MSMSRIHWPELVISIVLPQCSGFAGSFFTRSSVSTWYQDLVKPAFTPPGWVFAPVWIILYLFMGAASYLVLVSRGDTAQRRLAVILFYVHLAVNTAWAYLFFGLRRPSWALADIVVLLVMITVLIRMFGRFNRAAAALLVPYWLWVAFATYLNYGIWRLN